MIKIFDNLSNGEYLLKVKIRVLSPTLITLYGNHRHFLINERADKGDIIAKEFAIAIKDADFLKQENYRDNALKLILEGDCEADFELEKKKLPTVFTLGDSTVCNQEYMGTSPLLRCGGWGQALPMFLGAQYAVSNHAEQGTHTKNCLDCHFLKALEQIKKGDIVLCQFGHNDQKQPWLKPFEGYMENIITLGERAQKKGAEFIVCTPINRLIYVNGMLNDYLDLYRDAAKKAAEQLRAKCIDLHTFTSNMYLEMGKDAQNLFYHSPELDRTHPNDYGAIKIAAYVAKTLIMEE